MKFSINSAHDAKSQIIYTSVMSSLLTLFLLLTSSAALAESDAYRVEVIVFRHLQTIPESKQATELRSFSRFPDLEEKAQIESLPEDMANDMAEPSADMLTAELMPDDLSEAYRSDLPDDLHVVTEKSNKMDATWRRLRSSKGYRPLIYTAWEQNRVDYYPPMRIHDQRIIDTQLQMPTNILRADLTAQDPLAAYRSDYFQIDGSLQLRRSRFLHLYLDLELREEASQNEYAESANQGMTEASFLDTADKQGFTDTGIRESGAYGVYALQQNRQISTGEMQYFDTPYFGALVYVTHIRGN